MYLHLMEMSPHPERALRLPATRCGDLVPDAGHLRHMPTHIDVLCGQYKPRSSIPIPVNAIEADRRFLEREGPDQLLLRSTAATTTTSSIYGAMFLGQYGHRDRHRRGDDLDAAARSLSDASSSPPMADWLEGFVPMKQHVLIRFGKWQRDRRAGAAGRRRSCSCATTTMMRYAKTRSRSRRSGDIAAAAEEQSANGSGQAPDAAVPESRMVFNNTCLRHPRRSPRQMMDGEVAYRRRVTTTHAFASPAPRPSSA